jgi:hypothetical protein
MFYSDDPVRDFEQHDREQAKRLEELPFCEVFGKPIQDEHLYLINDEFVCEECLIRDFRKNTEDFIS